MLYETIVRFGIILIFLFSLQSSTRAAKSDQTETLTGRIIFAGSAPSGGILLRTSSIGSNGPENSEYLIAGPLTAELQKNFRGKVVTLEGTTCTSPSSQYTRCFKPSKITVD